MEKRTRHKSQDSQLKYLVDERAISRRVGLDIGHPIRVFNMGGLGLDQDRFLREMAPTFSLLSVDEYLMKLAQVNFLKKCFPHAREMLDQLSLIDCERS